jgi:hypothetical protein
MDEATKRRAAYRGWGNEDEGVDYTLHLAGDEVELSWIWGDEDNGGDGALGMSVTDLKRFVKAAKALLKATGNDGPLPLGRPESDLGSYR